jgi:putative membrane protein
MKTSLLMFAAALVSIPAAAQLPDAIEVPPGAMAPADVDFMRTADAANIDQLTLGARASGRAKNPGVRSLADNVVKSHKKADDALRLLAGVKHVDLRHEQTERGAAEAAELIRRDVPAERIYVEGVVRDNEDLIALYEDARANSPDPDIRVYADTMLPALRDHQRQAQDLLVRENVVDEH